ncbi:MAG: M20/M25/M40 family metallo-hydrolase [Desulfobacterales bacterium]|nr:M20/M25/M40 family metallo-hydrolase [Desulfobacterales bacterium]
MPVLLITAIFGALGGILILLIRYFSVKKQYAGPDSPDSGIPDIPEPDFDGFVHRLRRMIQIPTVSWTDRSKRDPALFSQFQDELVRLYPRVHQSLGREVHGDFGLIYHWQGKATGKKPVLFLAHYDVVPAEERGDETWEESPFSARVRDGVLWGRGTLDIKSQLAFTMETAELLLKEGWQPDRDIYFAFGGDEEISGREGAQNMAGLFKQRGLEFEFVLDEGGIIAKNQLAFLKDRPAALVGLAEKGFVTFEITAKGESGHSSMPFKEGTAVGRLARGVVRLEKRPFPTRLDPVLSNMLERFVPYVSTGLGIVFSNLWLTRPLIQYIFSKNKVTDSLIRTTQAVTVFKAGEQENVLPGEAVCLVNHRILPGDTIEMIGRRHRQTLGDEGLTLADAGNWPSNDPISAGDTGDTGFKLIRKVLAVTHPGVITVPYLVNGSTDSKYYRDLTGQILRFCPLVLTPEDVATIHGVNERVSLENLEKGLRFYLQLFSHL